MMRSIFNPGWAKILLNASSPALAAETSANRLPARTVIDTPLQRIIAQSSPELAPRTLAISLPYSSLERDFCRRRQAPQKGPEVDVSAQRPEIGDYHAREMAAKAAFLAASYQLRVLEAASLSGYLIAWPRRARQHPERVATIHRGDPPHDQSTNLLSCSADET
jgi:hypothetical protein